MIIKQVKNQIVFILIFSSFFSCKSLAPSHEAKYEEFAQVTEIELEGEIYENVDQMPRFPGCENMEGSELEKEDCAKTKMLQHLYRNLKYPNLAKKEGIEGMVQLQFVIVEDGTLKNIKVIKEIGGNCGAAAITAAETMNHLRERWTPGKQNGEIVKVLYNLPVVFKLNNKL